MATTKNNKVKFNLRNVHVAKLTIGDDGKYTYDNPKAIPGAVSLSLDAEGDSSPFYADGIVYYRPNTNNGYSGDLEIALIPDWFRIEYLQETKDTKGVLFEDANVMDKKYFALLFQFDGDQRNIRHVMYQCSVSRPSIASQTKESSASPVTETLELTADPRDDGIVKAKTSDETDDATYEAWFNAVYAPASASSGS